MKYIFVLIQLVILNASFGQTIRKIESLQSLYVEVFFNSVRLGKATGFIIKSKTQYYLITNWHVVTGKEVGTKNFLPNINQSPNIIKISHHSNPLGNYVVKTETLTLNFDTLYRQVIFDGKLADVVAIPLKDTIDISIFPVDYKITYEPLMLSPTERISIVGFPEGFKTKGLPIWKSGLIASETEFNPDNKPIIYIDVDGIGGMSGSPVYYISSDYLQKDLMQIHAIPAKSFFMGIFSSGLPSIKISYLWKSVFLKLFFDKLP